jgi:hypothetical protein
MELSKWMSLVIHHRSMKSEKVMAMRISELRRSVARQVLTSAALLLLEQSAKAGPAIKSEPTITAEVMDNFNLAPCGSLIFYAVNVTFVSLTSS